MIANSSHSATFTRRIARVGNGSAASFRPSASRSTPKSNYTSQFFANVYLDGLDQFVKHTLKCRHYLRYVDDLVLLDPDPKKLREWEQAIAAFLREQRSLALNPRSRVLAPVSNGCDFLGYVVRPSHRLVRRRVAKACREKLAAFERRLIRPWRGGVWENHDPVLISALRAMLASYQGHFRHASARGLTAALGERFPWLAAYFRLSPASPREYHRSPSRSRSRDRKDASLSESAGEAPPGTERVSTFSKKRSSFCTGFAIIAS